MSRVINASALPTAMEQKLRSIRRRQAVLAFCRAITIGMATLIAAMLVAMLADWAFTLFSTEVRVALTVTVLVLAAVAMVTAGLGPLIAALRWTHAAESADDEVPQLEERWTTVASFAASGRQPTSETARAMLRQVTSEAAVMERLVKPSLVARPASLRPAVVALGVCGLLLVGFLAVDWSQTSVLLSRFWSPTADITATQLRSISGDMQIPRGEALALVTELSGVPRAAAVLEIRTGPEISDVFELKPDDDRTNTFIHETIAEDSFRYRVRAGDDRTEWHTVEVIDYPALGEVRLAVTAPAYVDRPVYEKSLIPNRIKVVQGSQLELLMKPIEPVERLELALVFPGQTAEDEPIEQTVVLRPDADGWYRYEAGLLEDMSLSPRLLNAHGLQNEDQRICRIQVIPDKAPVARVITPTDEMAVAVDDVIEIKFEAHDDHGIATAELVVYDESETEDGEEPRILSVQQIPLDEQQFQKHVMATTELDLTKLELREGAKISYAIRVTDNRKVEIDPDTMLAQSTDAQPGESATKESAANEPDETDADTVGDGDERKREGSPLGDVENMLADAGDRRGEQDRSSSTPETGSERPNSPKTDAADADPADSDADAVADGGSERTTNPQGPESEKANDPGKSADDRGASKEVVAESKGKGASSGATEKSDTPEKDSEKSPSGGTSADGTPADGDRPDGDRPDDGAPNRKEMKAEPGESAKEGAPSDGKGKPSESPTEPAADDANPPKGKPSESDPMASSPTVKIAEDAGKAKATPGAKSSDQNDESTSDEQTPAVASAETTDEPKPTADAGASKSNDDTARAAEESQKSTEDARQMIAAAELADAERAAAEPNAAEPDEAEMDQTGENAGRGNLSQQSDDEKSPAEGGKGANDQKPEDRQNKSSEEGAPRRQMLAMNPQKSQSGQDTETNRRSLKITERLSAMAAASDRKTEKVEIRDRVVRIDAMLAEVEAGLTRLVERDIPDADRGEQFRLLDAALGDVDTYVAELRKETEDGQFAFVGLQMVHIARTHVTPARDRVFIGIREPLGTDHATVALNHVDRAREMLAALLKRYDRVARDNELARALEETVEMYEVYVEKTHQLMREARQNQNPLKRAMAVIEVDQDYLDRYAEVLTLRREMMAEFGRMLGDDPRLLSRYLELIKRRRSSLRDQLTELADRQDEMATELSGWLQVREDQRPVLWSIVAEMRLHTADKLAKDAADFVERTEQVMPLQLNRNEGTSGQISSHATEIFALTRAIEADVNKFLQQVENPEYAADLVADADRLVYIFSEFDAALDQLDFENEDVDEVAPYVTNRLLESRTVADQADEWAQIARHLQHRRYHGLAEVDQQKLAVATELLRVEMLGIEDDLRGQFRQQVDSEVPGEIIDMVRELHRVMEAITFQQSAATFAMTGNRLEVAELRQSEALAGFDRAAELFDKIRRAVIGALDEYDPPDPNIADLRDPTLDEFLARLEREPNIEAQLGIPNRPRNLRVLAEVMDWQTDGGVMLGDSSRAAAQRAKEAMRMAQAGKPQPQDSDKPEREMSEEEREQQAKAQDMQEMLERSLAKIEERAKDPNTTPEHRRKLEEMARNMQRMLEQTGGRDADAEDWDRIAESDAAAEILRALANGEAIPDSQWNKLLSTLDDGLWQVRGRTPPEDYRKAIEQYQDRIRRLMSTVGADAE